LQAVRGVLRVGLPGGAVELEPDALTLHGRQQREQRWRQGRHVMIICELCGFRTKPEGILEHLWEAHGIHEEWERWANGEVVVVDTTLEPKDF
jgi:hypothetical protein